mmetsp:Transcript_6701/g.17082  ORF Transcript_6701/g.17082 Transcript_6701/m.17082 type:complete len:659 (+) Transcript_6701:32-2008(+)
MIETEDEVAEPVPLIAGSYLLQDEGWVSHEPAGRALRRRYVVGPFSTRVVLLVGLAATLLTAVGFLASLEARRSAAGSRAEKRLEGLQVAVDLVDVAQKYSDVVCQAQPVYDFWVQAFTEHTFHFDDSAKGEMRGGLQFYAFPSKVAGTVPIWQFWNEGNQDHTYHAGGPWEGETMEKVIYYAYPLDVNMSGVDLVHAFWHPWNKEHTFHLGGPWQDEVLNEPQFYAFSQEHMVSAGCFQGGDPPEPVVGANLGGWLVLEAWIWHAEMESKHIRDEWTLIQQHGGNKDPRAINLIQSHWETFVGEQDLDRLRAFGVTHVRVPIGYWLVDYDQRDGFVDGGEKYLQRLLVWLKQRGMKAVLDLHALPGGQAIGQSFTGKETQIASFFLSTSHYDRGRRAIKKLAELCLAYDADWKTSGVVWGMELVNEPDWRYWSTTPGIRELYESMVPELRRMLPASRYYLFLNFMEYPRKIISTRWMEDMLALDPASYQNVVYDFHDYHSYGDDNKAQKWRGDEDACKTCCRDPVLLNPLVKARIQMAAGEYSLTTGFAGSSGFFADFLHNQLSLWRSTPGMLASFFWNHRVLPAPGGRYREFSLLDLLAPDGPLPPVKSLALVPRCPNSDLSKCPVFDEETVAWNSECWWKPSDPLAPRRMSELQR